MSNVAHLEETSIDSTAPAVAPVIESLSCTISQEGHCPSHFLSVIWAGNVAVVSYDTNMRGLCSLGYDEKTFEKD